MSDDFETKGTIARNKPTRKGIRLNMEEAKTLLNILKRVLDE